MNNTNFHPTPPVIPLVQNIDNKGNPPTANNRYILTFDPRPYPEVTANTPDLETVAMIKQDYAGMVSELTAITQYIFQNNSSDDETFANAMLQVAIVEMTHLDILGDAIHTLGGTTEFKADTWWTAQNVDYSMPRADMLRANIKAEQGAIDSYEKHAAATKNESVRALLLRIADDERLHKSFFEGLLEEELQRQSTMPAPVG